MRNLRQSSFGERRGSHGTHAFASRVRTAREGASHRGAARHPAGGAPRAAGRGRVLARRVPQARRRGRSRLRRRPRQPPHGAEAGGDRAADRDRRRRHRRPERGARRSRTRASPSTIYEAATAGSAAACTPTRSGYWANGQISEWCGELIDTGHVTIRALAQALQPPDRRPARGAAERLDGHVLLPRRRLPGRRRPTQTSSRSLRRSRRSSRRRAIRRCTTASPPPASAVRPHDASTTGSRPTCPAGMARAGRAPRRRLQRGVRRRDEGPGVAQPHLSARATRRPGHASRSSARRTSASTSRRQRAAAARRSRATSAARTIKLGWAMQSIRTNADGTISMTLLDAGQDADGDRRPRDPLHELRRARARSTTAAPGFDHRKQTAITQLGAGREREAPTAVRRAGTGTRPMGLERQHLHRPRHPEHVGRDARPVRRRPASSSTTRAATSPAGFTPSTPYSNAATNPQVKTYAKQILAKLETVFPGITQQWNGKASLSTPFRDPLLNCSYSYWKPGQYVGFSGYEGVAAGEHPLRRRALLDQLPGLHGRRRRRRSARGEGDAQRRSSRRSPTR